MIIMIKRKTPRSVTLPDGRTFVVKYRHVICAHFPANILLRHPYRQRAAPQGRHQQIAIQQGSGLGSNFLKFVKMIAKTPVVRGLGAMDLDKFQICIIKVLIKSKTKKLRNCFNLILQTH